MTAATFHRSLSRPSRLTVATILLALPILAGLLTLPVSLRWQNVQALDLAVRHAPSARPVVPFERFERSLGLNESQSPAEADRLTVTAYGITSWMGHDDLGRSLLYRMLLGFLVSLAIGLGSAMIALSIGVSSGAVSAYFGGRTDLWMMRFVDVLYGLPYTLMVILLKIALSRPLAVLFGENSRVANIAVLFLAIGGVSWLTMARVVRGQVLSLRSRTFVEAAHAAGAGPLRILVRHLLPNLIGPIIVYATLVIPQAILQEAFLSFLGIGIQQPAPSLGRLAADGVQAVNAFVSYWWLLVFPCGLLVLTLLALNFIGDGLRDAFDPKSSAAVLT